MFVESLGQDRGFVGKREGFPAGGNAEGESQRKH